MFAETSFDEEREEEEKEEELCAKTGKFNNITSNNTYNNNDNNNSDSTTIGGIVHLHHPGEEGFSCVAGDSEDINAKYDTRVVSGDSWLSNECHCVRCETVRVSTKLSKLQMHNTNKIVVVLLDLDNFGFNQFKSIIPRRVSLNQVDLMEHIFLWSFFGSCFARYHGTLPDYESVSQGFPENKIKKENNNNNNLKSSVWERLVREGRCHFTPCGGQKQAADGVIIQVARALTHLPVIIISGDCELLDAAHGNRRVIGKKSKRKDMNYDYIYDMEIINVLEHGKRFIPVWRELESKIYNFIK